ncbi:MAG: DUF362 domain-containing protein [Candidatus Hodarchaeota archaeon]
MNKKDNLISIKRLNEIERGSEFNEISNKISEILDETRFLVNDFDNIVIKPNLSDFRPPEEGGTTDVKIIDCLISEINKRGNPSITIVESDHGLASASDEFIRMGYSSLSKKYHNVNLVNLSRAESKQLKVTNGNYFRFFEAPTILLEMTKFISVAKLKTHLQQRITCIMKNQFGLIPRKLKGHYHKNLSRVLLDINEFFDPDLCIIDGIVGMEGAGPSDGEKIDTKIIIAGTDFLTTDIVAAKIMGIKPKSVPVLKYSLKNRKDKVFKPVIFQELPSFKFKFIPFYTYRLQRLAFWLEGIEYRIRSKSLALSSFLSEFAMGTIVLRHGYYITSPMGLVSRREVFRYGFGLLRRPLTLFKLKTTKQKISSLSKIGLLVVFLSMALTLLVLLLYQ